MIGTGPSAPAKPYESFVINLNRQAEKLASSIGGTPIAALRFSALQRSMGRHQQKHPPLCASCIACANTDRFPASFSTIMDSVLAEQSLTSP